MGSTNSKSSILGDEAFFTLILEYCDWDHRQQLFSLCKDMRIYSKSQHYYRWLCKCLSSEHGIYFPEFIPAGENWKSLFLEFFPKRFLWDAVPSLEDGQNLAHAHSKKRNKLLSRVNVFVRFRPLSQQAMQLEEEASEMDGRQITLPLHQRLAMIKMARGITNNRQALKILAAEGGWFQSKWEALATRNQSKCDGNSKSDRVDARGGSVIDIENVNNKSINPTVGGVKAEKMIAQVQRFVSI